MIAEPRERRERAGAGDLGRPFVLVTGGKGGVGKSTVAANLGVLVADELARNAGGEHAVLVDLDFGLANLDLLFGQRPERNLESFFRAEAELADCLTRVGGRLELLPAGSGSHEMGRPDQQRRATLLQALAELPCDRQVLIGDSPAGIGPDVLDFGSRADRVIVVTTPEPAAMLDAYGLLKALDAEARLRGKEVPTPELFVNRAADTVEAAAVAKHVRTTAERFLSRSPRLAGWCPESHLVRDSVRAREPFARSAPDAHPTRSLRILARRLVSLALSRPLRGATAEVSPLKASDRHVR